MNSVEEQLSKIEPSQRILLLPHCLRRTETCKAKYNKQGLQCLECNPDCPVNNLREAAIRYGYKGVCVAPGGRLAVQFVRESAPLGIVAVACSKELEEGVHGVRELADVDGAELPIVVIPLMKDGCVDTEVDVEQALEVIALGCSLAPVKGRIK